MLQQIVSGCREVLALFKRGKGQAKLEDLRKKQNLQSCTLKIDMTTRWNSAMQMKRSIIENCYLIADILAKDGRHD